ncbi:class I SAM-dependent methyltransferase [Paenibacillus hunanensis]|uniref:class I SAM-dependent methyltransferase n=1 Tax=Paenibacillus hunanensis TaxID=539262 RepID=UPI002A69C7C8|nr:class I SAM-dependent methyltransferase [Paenibacillus hunanensis]WPP43231.1 class I SAM-dependent methyltransferase [Paenibacillus hunanensis]
MQQPDEKTDHKQSFSKDMIPASNTISNSRSDSTSNCMESSYSADEPSNPATQLPMSWHSEAAAAYPQTIGHKIPAYSVLYELSGMILETGMNRQHCHVARALTERETSELASGNTNTSIDNSTNQPIHNSSLQHSITKACSLSAHQPAGSSTSYESLRHIAIIGAGGGQELVAWLPSYPHWLVTGVDPSLQMLDTARQRAEQAGITARCRLHIGMIDQLPERVDGEMNHIMEEDSLSYTSTSTVSMNKSDVKSTSTPDSTSHQKASSLRYDAASCLLVLHFLPHEQQQEMLNKLVATVKPGAPVIIACLSIPSQTSVNDWQMEAWHMHMQQNGITETEWQRFAHSISVTSYPPHADKMEAMLAQAGLVEISTYFQTLSIRAWCGRRALEGEG